ncbi:hypothetical protein LINGRAHAP2_LOCUS26112 [Linum grandiflorum]
MESRGGRARRDSDPRILPRHHSDLNARVKNNNAKPRTVLPGSPHHINPPDRYIPDLRRPHEPDHHVRRIPRRARLRRQGSHLHPGSMPGRHCRGPSPQSRGQHHHRVNILARRLYSHRCHTRPRREAHCDWAWSRAGPLA